MWHRRSGCAQEATCSRRALASHDRGMLTSWQDDGRCAADFSRTSDSSVRVRQPEQKTMTKKGTHTTSTASCPNCDAACLRRCRASDTLESLVTKRGSRHEMHTMLPIRMKGTSISAFPSCSHTSDAIRALKGISESSSNPGRCQPFLTSLELRRRQSVGARQKPTTARRKEANVVSTATPIRQTSATASKSGLVHASHNRKLHFISESKAPSPLFLITNRIVCTVRTPLHSASGRHTTNTNSSTSVIPS